MKAKRTKTTSRARATTRRVLVAASVLAAGLSAVLAAAAPDAINYQGVLRDASDAPLDGDYDMVFRFWSAESAGDEILIDRHLAVNLQAVTVSGGMFSVRLGTGEVLDGSGPGTYVSLTKVFANYSEVWLEVQVGSETLAPRMPVAAAGFALNASRVGGLARSSILTTSATAQTKDGKLLLNQADTGATDDYGLEATGQDGGAYFEDTDSSGYAYVGIGLYGIQAYGSAAGGYFANTENSGQAYLGRGDYGVVGYGTLTGGYFEDTDSSGHAFVGDDDIGIRGFGNTAGGYFRDTDGSGEAYLGRADYGVVGYGNIAGGYFVDSDSSGHAYVADGNIGILAYGNSAGGYFVDLDSSGQAYVGTGDEGIRASGTLRGGHFEDSDGSGFADLGQGDSGVIGWGNYAGGRFGDLDSAGWGRVGHDAYKVFGNGTVSFVQNHPDDPSRVIVYHAPEASEVAVYTRGMGRLAKGRAVVTLDPSFAWVANPSLGLTAHLTPRGRSCLLHTESITTATLTVASDDPACSEASFDYMVWGLRIGFEEMPVVTPKEREAYVPSMASYRDLYSKMPELRDYTARVQFELQEVAAGLEKAGVDTSAAEALLARIGEYGPAVHGAAEPRPIEEREAAPRDGAGDESRAAGSADGPVVRPPGGVAGGAPSAIVAEELEASAPETRVDPHAIALPVSEPVSAGDLLAVDPDAPGMLRLARDAADPGVVGVAAGPDEAGDDGQSRSVLVRSYGVAIVKVDAGFGSIRAGDLLTASPTWGHAMRALEVVPGTVLGKALEPLDAGTGSIRVLLTLR